MELLLFFLHKEADTHRVNEVRQADIVLSGRHEVLEKFISPKTSQFEEKREVVLIKLFRFVSARQIPVDQRQVLLLFIIHFVIVSLHLPVTGLLPTPSLTFRSEVMQDPILFIMYNKC